VRDFAAWGLGNSKGIVEHGLDGVARTARDTATWELLLHVEADYATTIINEYFI
jgi:hypothetical protein